MRTRFIKLFKLLSKVSGWMFVGGIVGVIPLMTTVGIGLFLALKGDGYAPAKWKDAAFVQLWVFFALAAAGGVLFIVELILMAITSPGRKEFMRYMRMTTDEYLRDRWQFIPGTDASPTSYSKSDDERL